MNSSYTQLHALVKRTDYNPFDVENILLIATRNGVYTDGGSGEYLFLPTKEFPLLLTPRTRPLFSFGSLSLMIMNEFPEVSLRKVCNYGVFEEQELRLEYPIAFSLSGVTLSTFLVERLLSGHIRSVASDFPFPLVVDAPNATGFVELVGHPSIRDLSDDVMEQLRFIRPHLMRRYQKLERVGFLSWGVGTLMTQKAADLIEPHLDKRFFEIVEF